jgi:hypothetical protein
MLPLIFAFMDHDQNVSAAAELCGIGPQKARRLLDAFQKHAHFQFDQLENRLFLKILEEIMPRA